MNSKDLFKVVCILFLFNAGAILYAGGVAERLPPRVTLEKEDMYLSPVSSPGVKDTLTIKLSVEPDRRHRMVVKEYRLTIRDAQGRDVRIWQNRDERKPGFFENIFIFLGFMRKPELAVPESIAWDGRDNEGRVVPDGTYTYVLEAWDDAGIRAESAPQQIVVDNTPPTAEVNLEYLVFSPDGDGRRDNLPIRSKSSAEERWKGEVLNQAGSVVATLEWAGVLPELFLWTGRDEKENRLADGLYSIRLSSTDPGGNSFTLTTSPVTIDTRSRMFTLGIDFPIFSPNRDGVQDVVTVTPSGFITEGLTEAVFEVVDNRGAVRRTERIPLPVPASVRFDGMDGAGVALPDGTYIVRVRASYENGAVATVDTPPIVLDTRAAVIQITATTPIISPNADGNKDDVTITITGGKDGVWRGIIADEAGNILLSHDHDGEIPQSLYFDGMGLDGRPIPDGRYVLFIEGRDRAGNRGQSNRFVIEVDARPTTLGAGTDFGAFSPNRDGVRDRIAIRPILHQNRATEGYRIRILDAAGRNVRTIEEARAAPAEIFWDGLDAGGRVVPDGMYTAEVMVAYWNGNRPIAVTSPFEVDTRFPEATVQILEKVLRGDPAVGERPLNVVQQTSNEESWVGEFVAVANRQVMFRSTWRGSAPGFSWNGLDLVGQRVPDGLYLYRLTGEDRAGNRAVFEVPDIRVSWILPELRVVPQLGVFSPNGDGIKDTLSFDLSTNIVGIARWAVNFLRGETVVSSIGERGAPPKRVEWDGKNPQGTVVPDGTYTVRFNVEYEGREISALSPIPIRVDTTPPLVTFDLDPIPFSPDHDGVADILEVKVSVKDESTIESWGFKVLDPAGREFQSLEGQGEPPTMVVWDGYSKTGELVQSAREYPVQFVMVDEVGNAARGSLSVKVDVLVFQEAGKERIRVANVQFAPWTTDYLKWNEEIARTNVISIDQIAMMLKFYPNYRVRLEGHAVSVLYRDREASAREHRFVLIPLSRNRAGVIKDALIDLGIPADRIDTRGYGGEFPLVPFSDYENRWINRRVEFILVRDR